MMRLRGEALLMSSSSPLNWVLRRAFPLPQCFAMRSSASYRSFTIASPSPWLNSRLHLSRSRSRSRFCSGRIVGVRASHQVSDSGSIDSSMMQSMENKIKEQLNAETVVVKDAYGDGRHVSIFVVSSEFEGQSAVNRQRMVYKAIWEELQSTVHAVDQMITHTPSEATKNE